jgi:hypothetical protein
LQEHTHTCRQTKQTRLAEGLIRGTMKTDERFTYNKRIHVPQFTVMLW